jgi:P-aminobenzoate N-oxygenase AurF
MNTYEYADCLEKSYRVNWKISDVIGGHRFDQGRRWLPARLSAAGRAPGLTPEERVKLSHVEMGAYAHLFGYVEEYIAPMMGTRARDFAIDDRPAFDALTNFAAEEVKHMHLFREMRAAVDGAIGFPLALLPGASDVARVVLGKDIRAVLLLTDAIEWMTQLHYLSGFKDDDALDPFTKHVFKCHWLEESQHARMDHLETLRAYAGPGQENTDAAIDDLIALVGAVDGLLQTQAGLDVDNFERYLGRPLRATRRGEVHAAVLAAKRYTFIESGVTHPTFQELFQQVATPAQQARVQSALGPVLAPAA